MILKINRKFYQLIYETISIKIKINYFIAFFDNENDGIVPKIFKSFPTLILQTNIICSSMLSSIPTYLFTMCMNFLLSS